MTIIEIKNLLLYYKLSEAEQEEILIKWLVNSIPSGDKILQRFLQVNTK